MTHKTSIILIVATMWYIGSCINMFNAGIALGRTQPSDQVIADAYFAGQEDATNACQGLMDYTK